MSSSSASPLQTLRARLAIKADETFAHKYLVPGRWLSTQNAPAAVAINPYQVWLNTIDWILKQPVTEWVQSAEATPGSWSRHAVVYNLFVRSATAFDHDGDGVLGRPNNAGMNEVGTFVKSLMLLRYIKQLGCNTIHLLPITAVGQDGSKGDMGSPYAIRNPYRLDENLAEPGLDLGVETEFAAFVEAAHHLGLRVVVEFVFRTSSKDGDWVQEHPDWFYWIDADLLDREPGEQDPSRYGMPIFSETEITAIETAVNRQQFDHLMPPDIMHRRMFLPPPAPEQVQMEDGRWIAHYANGRRGRIPGAFADWPVDDPQPPWGDVTFLRLYDHPHYNYIAYNTIRMYSSELAQPENVVKPLWERIVNIIPHYQRQFGIDGAMIDMGHALPPTLKQAIVTAARDNDPAFAFWDENFQATEQGVAEGYNAVIGSLPFVLAYPPELEAFLVHLARTGNPLPIFGTTESHNTPRAISKPGGERFVKYGMAVAAILPALPFLHCGVEFGETRPVNTGLRFTPEEMAQYPSHTLPLFSAIAYDWTNDTTQLLAWWQQALALRQKHAPLLSDIRKDTFIYTYSDNPAIWGIIRHNDDWSIKIALLVNSDMDKPQGVTVGLPTGREKLMDHFTDTFYDVSGNEISLTLAPGQVVWLEL
ncbi:MAG: alpha-amylase [Ardenticatenales bacterium]|nr:alpha-amylase [Ardenticatenales bacterium]